jgi:fido (protein-threonine AMPylation protein)
MFGRVWIWAGSFSKEFNRMLGVDANQIEPELKKLAGDMSFRIEKGTQDNEAELLADYHHRLTVIHPFPNGNGRWARLMTDELARFINAPPIVWGGAAGQGMLHKVDTGARDDYLAALRAADGFDLGPLTALIRSYSDQ